MRLRTILVVVTAAVLGTALAQPAAAKDPKSNGGAMYAPAAAPDPAPQLPAPPPTQAPTGDPAAIVPSKTGGQAFGQVVPTIPAVTVPGRVAKILPNGYAAAPADAPPAVQQAIFAANQIVGRPYVYGGGHQAFIASGYDCSGTVSYALHGASLLDTPMDSTGFMSWGVRGPGQWITVYSNSGHAFMTIAGIRLDTSAAGDPSHLSGPRWRPLLRSHSHFKVRSLPGL